MIEYIYNMIYYVFWWILPPREKIKSTNDEEVERTVKQEKTGKKKILKSISMHKINRISMVI